MNYLRALVIVLMLTTLGCGYRRWGQQPPGPIQQQQFNASIYDPYSDNEIGPEVVGGRPREFQNPLSDTDRTREVGRLLQVPNNGYVGN